MTSRRIDHLYYLSLLAVFSSTATAAGFYISEVGTPHSLGTAGVANPTNTYGADSSWANPAGMTALKEDQFYMGAQVVIPVMRFESSQASAGGNDGGNAGITTPIPSMFYVNKFSERLSFGISMAAIIGGGVDYGDDFVGRYATQEAQLSGVGLSPSFGFKVTENLSVGAGVSVIYTKFEQSIAIRTLPGNPDGKLEIEKADDFGAQPFFSVNLALPHDTLFSVVYRSEMDVELSGKAKIRTTNFKRDFDTDIDWTNPQWLEVGIKHKLNSQDNIYFNAGWQDWSAFSKNSLAFSGNNLNPVVKLDRKFKDTWHAGAAFSHVSENRAHAFGVGFAYESSPVNDANRTYDLPVDEIFKLSGSYAWKGRKNFDFAVGSTLYVIGDAAIEDKSQLVTSKGEFDTNIILFIGATARYIF